MLIYNVNNFPYKNAVNSYGIVPKPSGKKKYRTMSEAVCAFDIETTNLASCQNAVMYIWQFAFDEFGIVMGRTWEEFHTFLERLQNALDDKWLAVYVHNLSYEFEFLQGQFDMSPDDVFAVESRKVLNCDIMGQFEFRCSYLQTNMSLRVFTEEMGVSHKKLDGDEYDYKKLRFPWSPMTRSELEYCCNDVLGLVEAIKVRMSVENDTLLSIPKTSTGYVRRDVKKALYDPRCKWVQRILPDMGTYVLLREAFRGGNTHANRHYVGSYENVYTLYNVKSRDLASAYPAAQINRAFPVTQFRDVADPTLDKAHFLMSRNNALLLRVTFGNIRLRSRAWGVPYISRDKALYIAKTFDEYGKVVDGALYDNGRVVRAKTIQLTLTDIDLRIVEDEYIFDRADVEVMQCARYGRLPASILDVVRKYYKDKTELKGVPERELFYKLAKAKLNAIYGMSAQNPVKFNVTYDIMTDENGDIIYENGKPIKAFSTDFSKKAEELLAENNSHVGFPYQWGVWTTAWCRWQLEQGIKLVQAHYDPFNCYFVYCDTDSIKYVDNNSIIDWSAINTDIEALSRMNGGVATDPKGIEHPIGIFEEEEESVRFRTLGAKRYVQEFADGSLKLTVAGVNKKKGAEELKRMGGIEAFKDNITFFDGGGTISKFNDCGDESIEVDGHILEIPANVYIEESTKTISRTEEYINVNILFAMCKEYLNRVDKEGHMWYNEYNEMSKTAISTTDWHSKFNNENQNAKANAKKGRARYVRS